MDMNSEPKNISRVRSRSTRLPVELQQTISSFGDGGLGRRQGPNSILNSPDNNFQLSSRYYWGAEPEQQPPNDYTFTVKVGRSPINQSNINNNNNPPTDNTKPSASASSGHLGLSSESPAVHHNHSTIGGGKVADNRSQDDLQSTHVYERFMKDTTEILESPTITDPDLYLRNSIQGSPFAESDEEAAAGDVGRTIGAAVEIADYEGSPRRFGAPSSSSLGVSRNAAEAGKNLSPLFRPGFPQRVILATTPEQPEKCDRGKDEENGVVPFDYVYEFSETRKVLNEFFDKSQEATASQSCQPQLYQESSQDLMFLDSQEGSAGDTHILRNSKNFTLSPETTDYDSNCGDLDSYSNDLIMGPTDYGRLTAMPVLEDGLSSGHASDTDSHHQQQQQASSGSEISREVSRQVGDGRSQEPKEEAAEESHQDVNDALKEIQTAIQRAKVLADSSDVSPPPRSPVWVPRLRASQESLNSDFNLKDDVMGGVGGGGGDLVSQGSNFDEVDTDLETDRLLGQQRLEDHFYQEDNNWVLRNKMNLKGNSASVSSAIRHDTGSTLLPGSPTESRAGDSESGNSPQRNVKSPTGSEKSPNKTRNKEGLLEPTVLIEGVLFRAKYLGSTQLVCEGQPTKSTRMMQAEEAVSRIKAPEGESQPSTEVDLFISTEKIMVLNTDLKEIMMDHTLRTISYIADIGDLVVLMARRRLVPQDVDDAPKQNRTPKMICHVFESEEAQFIAQSIGQAFQVAYVEFLKANGIEDHSFVKDMDYQEVLNSQEIFGDELEVFAKKELQKEVVVPKAKGEILGVVIVESGWGSMLPTVVIANLLASGAAARCGHLNIGDQIIAINGLSLVGLPLSTCQTYIRNVKNQTAVKFTVVPCAPVVEVKIKRPNTKYQLGFSVQNGVICSLLRGGIAERGGVRVGHRIIEINNQSVVAVPHEKIVTLLATSVGEILMKTMPTSMFRLLTGQENPIYI